MNEYPTVKRLTRVFVGIAVIGGCLVIGGIVIVITVGGSEMPILATASIGTGAIMILLGLRSAIKGRRMVHDVSVVKNEAHGRA